MGTFNGKRWISMSLKRQDQCKTLFLHFDKISKRCILRVFDWYSKKKYTIYEDTSISQVFQQHLLQF